MRDGNRRQVVWRVTQRKVGELLNERHRPRNPLERLVKRAAMRRSCTDQVRALVPPAIAPHCSAANVHGNRLTIDVAGSSWATRLRLELPKIEPALRSLADFAAVREIHIRTTPIAFQDVDSVPPRK